MMRPPISYNIGPAIERGIREAQAHLRVTATIELYPPALLANISALAGYLQAVHELQVQAARKMGEPSVANGLEEAHRLGHDAALAVKAAADAQNNPGG